MNKLQVVTVLAGLTFLAPTAIHAQGWMPDSSSTSVDIWSDASTFYAVGYTFGSMSVHTYAVDVNVVTSLGQYYNFPGGELQMGTVSTATSVPWDFYDDGEYLVTVTHRGYCLAAQAAFTLAWAQLRKRPGNQSLCADNSTVSSCNDGNNEAPLGRRIGWSCRREDQCCKAGGAVTPGYCRKEKCAKSGGQANDPQPSACMSQLACQDGTIAVFCLAGI